MGQEIALENVTQLDDVAMYDLDRSLTGQDGVVFHSAPEPSGRPPAVAARRIFNADDAVQSVFILSNTVSVRRDGGWHPESVERTAEILRNLFVVYEPISAEDYYEKLREDNYNATITHIRAHNEDLWVMRVERDEPGESFKAGQYTTLGLGFWEPRADHVMEDFDEDPEQLEKMARRSYSVSSSIVDENGELVEAEPDELEFYIVQVRPGEVEVPALTPRIFMKDVGDRIFMSHKFTGRYTLDDVEPEDNIVFLSTGTGEAPQNNMAADLLRNDHRGRILNVVCVRYWRDLAYLDQQGMAEERFPNYSYEAITTREPENEGNKVYIQDLVISGRVEEMLGSPLAPSNTHVFLCGNPAMIGLPDWDDDENPHFPDRVGVCQLLHERGFTIDHRRKRGNVHYEEYWKEN